MKRKKDEEYSLAVIARIFPYMRRYRPMITAMVLCGLAGSAADVIFPLFQRWALDEFVGHSDLSGLASFAVLYVLTVLFSATVNYISCAFAMTMEMRMNRDLRNAAFRHLQELSVSFFATESVGRIHSRVMSDTSRIGELCSWSLMDFVWHTSYLIGAEVVMFSVNAKLALFVTAVVPLIAVIFSLFQKKLISVNREVREINSDVTGKYNEMITGAKTVKTLRIEEKLAAEFDAVTAKMRRRSVSAARLRGLFAATLNFASSFALAVVLWRGGVIAREQLGTFSAFMSYAQGMMEPVRWIIDAISDVVTSCVNIGRVTDLIALEPKVKDSPEVVEKYGDVFKPKRENWEPMRGDIELEHVDFAYDDELEDGEPTYVLENFDLKIPFGSTVAIVGETGAGKSTLVNLICRFYEPTAGRVLVDGRDARERSVSWLRDGIGYVLQTPHLFSGTIRDNLTYGAPDATEDELWEVLRLVAADEMVAGFEKGLDTDVGEGGDLLSAGEKQLISFAAAVLSDPKILILDEATAEVDTLTERKLQAALDKIVRDRTLIMIAHRLSTVRDADVILVVDDGRVAERGTHDELIRRGGIYAGLWKKQFENESTMKALA